MTDYKIIKYWILIIISLLNIAIIPLLRPYDSITSNTISCIEIAKDIPNCKINLFPIGDPKLLKIGCLFSNEFYFSSRFISCLSFIVIMFFSCVKKFYFKETAILVTFKFLIYLYTLFIFESVFFTLFYILIYYLSKFLTENELRFKIIFSVVIITVYLTVVRYIRIYGFIVILIYFFYYTLRYKLISKNYFYYLLLSSLGIYIYLLYYLLYNYIGLGSFLGVHRFAPALDNIGKYTLENLLGTLSVVNPIFSIKILESESIIFFIMIGIVLIGLFFLMSYVWFYRVSFNAKINSFNQLLLTIACVYFTWMFDSEYTQGIESLNTKMLAPTFFCFYFSFLILFFKIYLNKLYYIFIITILFLVIKTMYLLKSPVNYLSYRLRVMKVFKERKNLKYFLSDTAYSIPLLNKKIEYIHPYLQSGYINANIVRSINPDIKCTLKDNTIINKSLILYNS